MGARSPPTLLNPAHKQQLPITLLQAEIHARLCPDLLPRSSASVRLVWTASQPQTLPQAHKHPTVTHIVTTSSSQPARLALTGQRDTAWGQALGHGGTRMKARLAGLRKEPCTLPAHSDLNQGLTNPLMGPTKGQGLVVSPPAEQEHTQGRECSWRGARETQRSPWTTPGTSPWTTPPWPSHACLGWD